MVRLGIDQSAEWAYAAAESAEEQARLVYFVNYLLSEQGQVFHSDFEFQQVRVPRRGARLHVQEEFEAAEAHHGDDDVTLIQKVALTHTFRTPLAGQLLHALDEECNAVDVLSAALGAPLSLQKAEGLQVRADLLPLFDAAAVRSAIANGKRRRSRKHGRVIIDRHEDGDEAAAHMYSGRIDGRAAAVRTHSHTRMQAGQWTRTALRCDRQEIFRAACARVYVCVCVCVCHVCSPLCLASACGWRPLQLRCPMDVCRSCSCLHQSRSSTLSVTYALVQ